MHTLTMKEWKHRYRCEWRAAFKHLPPQERARLVRGCMGKAIYDSHEEARSIIGTLPLRPGELLGTYECPLCSGIHTGNRKYLRWDSARRYARIKRCGDRELGRNGATTGGK